MWSNGVHDVTMVHDLCTATSTLSDRFLVKQRRCWVRFFQPSSSQMRRVWI